MKDIVRAMMKRHYDDFQMYKNAMEINRQMWVSFANGNGVTEVDESNPHIIAYRQNEKKMLEAYAMYFALKDCIEKEESGWVPEDD